tara:strand:+ start:576 stop:707 length:132 start_codon:yes stop_codon:yes gene_type:complete
MELSFLCGVVEFLLFNLSRGKEEKKKRKEITSTLIMCNQEQMK